MGVGTRNSEIGIRFPAKINLLSFGDLKDNKLLREYLGLYSKVTIDNMFSTGASFHAQMGFSFFPRSSTIASDTTFFSRNNIAPEDEYVNIIDMYALFATTFEAPVKIPGISRVTFTPGLHYMKWRTGQRIRMTSYLTEHFTDMTITINHILDMEMVKSHQLKNLVYTVVLM